MILLSFKINRFNTIILYLYTLWLYLINFYVVNSLFFSFKHYWFLLWILVSPTGWFCLHFKVLITPFKVLFMFVHNLFAFWSENMVYMILNGCFSLRLPLWPKISSLKKWCKKNVYCQFFGCRIIYNYIPFYPPSIPLYLFFLYFFLVLKCYNRLLKNIFVWYISCPFIFNLPASFVLDELLQVAYGRSYFLSKSDDLYLLIDDWILLHLL